MLPADRRHRIVRRQPARHHRRAGRQPDVGAPGSDDRSRHRRLDGTQEARRLFLMALALAPEPAGEDMLRFITCGSVDDGKSTLIGRLLFDAKVVPEDHLAALTRDGRQYRAFGDMPDLALLVDGLQAEREQGITIDVGYRFFSTPRRRFIIADTPGHEQYTRNMATRASTAGLAAVTAIPLSALLGDNVIRASAAMPWYGGPTLLKHLETVSARPREGRPFRLAVQWINHDGTGFRGYAGTVLGGSVRPGDEIVVLPSGLRGHVERIVTYEGDLERAVPGQAVTLTLAAPIDVARGDLIADANRPPHMADQFAAHLVWMHEAPMLPGRPYLMRLGTTTLTATVSELKHQLDISTGTQEAAKQLAMNEIGFANLALDRPMPFDIYGENRETGSFVLIDRISNATVGAGMIRFPLRRAANLSWHKFTVDKAERPGDVP